MKMTMTKFNSFVGVTAAFPIACVALLAGGALLACGGGEGTHKTSFPMKDEAGPKPKPKQTVPVAKSIKDLIGGQLVSVNILGAGAHDTAVRKAIGSKPGDAYNTARVGWDIRAIWATGKVDDVQAKGVLTGPGKVVLTYTIKPRSIVRTVVYQGNKAISTDALNALGKFKDGELLNMVKVFVLRDRVGDLYTEQGHLFATVKAKVRPLSNGRVDVAFTIVERERVQIAAVKLTGISVARKKALLALIKEKNGANAVGGSYVAAKFRRSLNRVTDYYFNRGFINVAIAAPKVSFLSKNKKRMTVSVKIKEGKRFRVGKVAVKGKLKGSARAYRAKLGLRRFTMFSRAKVVTAMKRLVAFHKSKGVDTPKIVPVTKIHEKRAIIDITFEIR